MRVEVCSVANRGTYNFDDHGKFRWITQHGARPPPDRCARPIAEPGMTIEQKPSGVGGQISRNDGRQRQVRRRPSEAELHRLLAQD